MNLGFRNKWRNWTSTLQKDPVLIFGFPKSGTSAITALLAHRTNKSVTLDTKYLWEPYLSKIKKDEIDLRSHLKKFSYPFSKDIIKEPNMVFMVEQLLDIYSNPKIVVIKRDKLNNIRSILNRLEIPGDLRENPIPSQINKNWRGLLLNDGKHYIDVLNQYYQEAEKNLSMLKPLKPVKISYENFNRNKEKEIDRIAKELNLKTLNNINHLLNKEFQPKGNNKVSVEDFFGENIKKLT